MENLKNIKLYLGAMSLYTTDVLIDYYKLNRNIGIISSRRQVDYDGGYVNNWTTQEFSEYVSDQSDIILERDHGGPSQGNIEDNGIDSFIVDAAHLDMIHIDPWKRSMDLTKGIETTIADISQIHQINKDMLFEIGTEQAIRHFSTSELHTLLDTIREGLGDERFSKIAYLAIQTGTKIVGNKNTGIFDPVRAGDMVLLCREYGLLSKDHNGDYLDPGMIKYRFELGVDAVNIAPQIGSIESSIVWDHSDSKEREVMFQLCFYSKKWVKWFPPGFNPTAKKETLFKSCGHYVMSQIDYDPSLRALIKIKIFNFLDDILE